MRMDVISIFPQFFEPLSLSLVGKANASGLLDFHAHDLRQWATDKHRTVDDTPTGGGAGMVMRPDVWGNAIESVLADSVQSAAAHDLDKPDDVAAKSATMRRVLIVPTPSGETFTQRVAEDLSSADQLIFACGRYEGIDARVAQHYAGAGIEVREMSIGDYVLNGGEVASIVMTEAIVRLIPGFMGNPESLVEESHGTAGLLEYPVYTRPNSWNELDVPEVLTSGHHAKIAQWRRERAFDKTIARRPDMIEAIAPEKFTKKDRAFLQERGWRRQADGHYLRPLPTQDEAGS